jgi:aryl-alcohol dehydrogenase
VFLPLLFELWGRGDFRVDRFMTAYDFDRIEQAAHDTEAGAMIKPVLRMT